MQDKIPDAENIHRLGLSQPKEIQADPSGCIWVEWSVPRSEAEMYCARPDNEGKQCNGICGYAVIRREKQ